MTLTTDTTERFAAETILTAAYNRQLQLHTWQDSAQILINGTACSASHYRHAMSLIRSGYLLRVLHTNYVGCNVSPILTTEDGNELLRKWRQLSRYRSEND